MYKSHEGLDGLICTLQAGQWEIIGERKYVPTTYTPIQVPCTSDHKHWMEIREACTGISFSRVALHAAYR